MYRIEFEAGLGDILLQIYRTAGYRFLNHIQCDEEATVLLLSSNPHVPELFQWHPNADRMKILYVPADTRVALVRQRCNLAPNPSSVPDCDCPIVFYGSPSDAAVRFPKKYIVLAAGAGTSSRIIPQHIIDWVLQLGAEYRIHIVAVGRNYIDERRDTIRSEPRIPDAPFSINLVDALTVPGVCNVVKQAAGVICSHSAVCMLAWLEHIPTFLLYGYDVWERHVQLNDGYCFGLAHYGNQHAQFEHTRNPHQLSTFFEFIRNKAAQQESQAEAKAE